MQILLVTVAVAEEKLPTPKKQLEIASALAPSMVRVEYTLKHDKGQAPNIYGWGERCPNCGRFHGLGSNEYIDEERPMEIPGLLVSPRQVITLDNMIHPRFVKDIEVRFKDQVVKAKINGYATKQSALLLEIAESLADAKPAEFISDREPPYLSIGYSLLNGAWTINVKPLAATISQTETNRQFWQIKEGCLIVDKNGDPVGIYANEEMPFDDSWKGSPLKWPTISAEQMSNMLAKVEKIANEGLVHVSLNFRSPKKKEETNMWSRYSRREDDEDATQRDVVGVLTEDTQVLVLANLKPNVTARLEKIMIHSPQSEKPVPASFMNTLKDYGCFLARLEKPMPGKISFSAQTIDKFRNQLLLNAEIIQQGKKRTSYYQHSRIAGFQLGWQRQIFPTLGGDTENTFLFDDQGEMLAFPIARRKKVSVQERWDYDRGILTPTTCLTKVFTDLANNIDSTNMPLSEQEENRLAWMGVELQALNKDLARANKVSHLTNDGQSGALVTYIYPDSPAMKAGIEQGYILLRLHVEGHPKPLEIQLEDRSYFGMDFAWEQLDQLPEQFFDQMPKPWPSAENTFTIALTELGFGTKYKAEFFHDEKTINKDFTVAQSPRHYDSAPQYKSKPLGLTVRELTYEVRRHFQKKIEDPGVIVSKIEKGSKASVAGIKPYEIITHVNDKSIHNKDDFKKLVEGQKEMRLSVERMTKRRLVKIKAPTTQPSTKPSGNIIKRLFSPKR
jgi:hypothetical protein